MVLRKGQRVMTSLGSGTVLGFEVFNAKGWPVALREIDPQWPSRVAIQLDDSSRWVFTPLTPNPYFTRGELSELKE